MPEQESFQPNNNNERPENREAREQFDHIKFTVNEDKKGKKYYVSTDYPERKMIELESSSEIPEQDMEYLVEIVEDTKPDEPLKGKYIARIIGRSEKDLTPKEWGEAEEHIETIAPLMHKGRLVDRELYKETTITKKQRQEMGPEALLTDTPDIDQGLVIEELEKERKEINADIEGVLKGPLLTGTPEQRLIDFEKVNLIRAVREYREYEKMEEQLRMRESQMRQTIDDALRRGEPTRGKTKVLERIENELDEIDTAKQLLVAGSPEAFYGIHVLELKRDKKAYENGEIVELPSVKKNIDEIVSHLRSGEPVLLYGHYGTGKTEIAMHVARKYLKKEALVISGSKDTSLADLYGHHVLKLDKPGMEELKMFSDRVEQEFNEWVAKHEEASDADKDRAHERILQTHLTMLGSGTVTEFVLGKLNQAIVEDTPIIIDELNAIPHETLISLNYYLTRRAGRKVQLQRDSNREVTVGTGYNVMATGNLGLGEEKYVDRQNLDPAFRSRFWEKKIDYLPQSQADSLGEAYGHNNELFRLMVARLMDEHGNLEIPKESIEKLWDFARASRVFQDVFSGHDLGSAYYKQTPGGAPKTYFLQETVPSHREIGRVLDQWRGDNYKYELDYYIWREFLSQSTNKADREYMYQILKGIYGFFDDPVYDKIATVNEVSRKPVGLPKEFYGPRQTVEFVIANGPQRKELPGHKKKKKK